MVQNNQKDQEMIEKNKDKLYETNQLNNSNKELFEFTEMIQVIFSKILELKKLDEEKRKLAKKIKEDLEIIEKIFPVPFSNFNLKDINDQLLE